MSLELAVGAALFTGIVAYAVFGGADFGSGLYDLTAGGSVRGAALRTRIDHSIGPVWEANHVWLIYVLVTWWTGFPVAFAAAMDTLIVPMLLALLGIVLRGAAFAFRKYAATLRQARLFGALFAGSSLITPYFLGSAVGAIASGRVPLHDRGDRWASWLNPTSATAGVMAMGTCAFLAGVFLVADATRAGDERLAAGLRTRTIVVALATGVLALVGLVAVHHDAPTLWQGLTGRAVPLVILSALAGLTTLALLVTGRPRMARFAAVGAVVAVLGGWGAAQYPWLLVDHVRIRDAGGADATLAALLVVSALAAVLVLPALAWLFALTQSEAWSRH